MKWVNAIKIIILLTSIAYSQAGFSQTAMIGQSPFYANNVKQVDAVAGLMRSFCDSIKPLIVSKKNIKYDQKYIRYANKLFNTVTSDSAFAQDAKKNDLVLSNSLNAGLVGFREYKFYPSKGYLAISIFLSVIDDNIVYKKIIIESPTKRECSGSSQPVPFFDFLYFQKEILPVVDFPIKSCTDCDSLIVDTLYQSVFNDMAKRYPGYKFIPNASTDQVKALIFQHTYLQKSTYNNKVAPEGFIRLIRLKEYEIIKSLLYSPNELVAINAYETLVYLVRKGELTTNPQDEAKMKEILNSGISIPVFCGRDCKPANFTYNTLKVKEKDIIDKYEASLGE